MPYPFSRFLYSLFLWATVFAIINVFIIAPSTSASADINEFRAKGASRYCGSDLANILNAVCNGKYASPYGSRRKREGVYDECCQNPCTVDNLLRYCA